jgi:hypothetical protein
MRNQIANDCETLKRDISVLVERLERMELRISRVSLLLNEVTDLANSENLSPEPIGSGQWHPML